MSDSWSTQKIPLGANFHQDPEKFFRTHGKYKLNKRLYKKWWNVYSIISSAYRVQYESGEKVSSSLSGHLMLTHQEAFISVFMFLWWKITGLERTSTCTLPLSPYAPLYFSKGVSKGKFHNFLTEQSGINIVHPKQNSQTKSNFYYLLHSVCSIRLVFYHP